MVGRGVEWWGEVWCGEGGGEGGRGRRAGMEVGGAKVEVPKKRGIPFRLWGENRTSSTVTPTHRNIGLVQQGNGTRGTGIMRVVCLFFLCSLVFFVQPPPIFL